MEWTSLHENLIDPLFIFNLEKGIVKYNLSFILFFELSPREVRKIKNLSDFINSPNLDLLSFSKTTTYQHLEFTTPKGTQASVLVIVDELPDQTFLIHMKDAAIEISLQKKYAQQILELQRLNKDQEKIIEERTKDLKESYLLMQRVLSSLKGEVYVINENNQIKAGFGPGISHDISGDLFQKVSVHPEDIVYFNDWYKSYVALEDQRDILIGLAPEKLRSQEKILKPDFYQIPDATQFEMAVIMNDITDAEALRMRSMMADELSSAIHKALLNKNSFSLFLASFNNLREKYLLHQEVIDLVTFKRDLHTLKGLLSQYGHLNAASQIHVLEEEAAVDQNAGMKKLNQLLESTNEIITKLIHLIGENILMIEDKSFTSKGISDFFQSTLNDSLKALGKSVSLFELDLKENLPFSQIEADNLMVAILHYARNVAAHASELPEERVAKGKRGNISLQFIVQINQPNLEIIIIDDGKGTHKQNDIFDQLSSETSKNADLYSGRGLGMAAIKEAMNKLGGNASFKSTVDVGSTLTLHFPKSS